LNRDFTGPGPNAGWAFQIPTTYVLETNSAFRRPDIARLSVLFIPAFLVRLDKNTITFYYNQL
jgi:hypothetical protein